MRRKPVIILSIIAVVVLVAILVVFLLMQKPAAPSTVNPQGQGVQTPSTSVVPGATPEETVERYLNAWRDKDIAGMDALRIPVDRGLHNAEDLKLEASLDVASITRAPAEEAEARFAQSSLTQEGERALVYANFTVHYNEEGKASYLRDAVTHDGYAFWLVKEPEGWLIALQGY